MHDVQSLIQSNTGQHQPAILLTANAMSSGSADLNLLLQLHVGGGRKVQLLRQLRHLRLQSALRRPGPLTPLQGNQRTAGAITSPD